MEGQRLNEEVGLNKWNMERRRDRKTEEREENLGANGALLML